MLFNIWIIGTLISMPLLSEEHGKVQNPIVCMFWPLICPIAGLMWLVDWWHGPPKWDLPNESCERAQSEPVQKTAADVRNDILGMCPEEEKFYRDNNLD